MNFVFAADKNYLPHFETVLKSVMCYHENVYIFLLMNEAPPTEFIEKINYYLNKRNSRLLYYVLSEKDFAGLQGLGRYSNMMFARYFIARLFPHQKDNRWCYLDIDIVVNENLTPIFELMNGYAIAAVKEKSLPNYPAYFNSGVLFFNSDLWWLNEQTLIQTTQQMPNLSFPDQEVLNHVIQDNYYPIAEKYNYQIRFLYKDIAQFLKGEQSQFVFPAILHFSESTKPWHNHNGTLLWNINFDDLDVHIQTHLLYGHNLFDFYASLNWEMIVNLPIQSFKTVAKQLYKQNFDYAAQGVAEIALLD
ncbi:glycosyltransferase family 8 protein [Lonepinella sp. BR2357]|uniref:glycosyltransferase family 8 protein n=1 Tax=Lonepinella sp. BR2357 TaxID=3434549 RepID=UPI003F6E15B3